MGSQPIFDRPLDTRFPAWSDIHRMMNRGRNAQVIFFSADNGEKLLKVQTGARGGMGPPVTYMLDGKQYVALLGGTGVVIGGFGPPAGNTTPLNPRLFVYALD